ncbi:MAG: hypothetical protein KF861_23300, partial [Planctomycetaceae bacterium]|nr:hypothetical protein [Planctomycetaceae bacterium]
MPTQPHQNRIGRHMNEAGGDEASLFSQCRDVTRETIEESPMLATLIAFGVGIGLGAAVGGMLVHADTGRRHWNAEALGRRVLDSIADALPDSVR